MPDFLPVIFLVIILILSGWLLFSLVSGFVIYLSFLTTNHVSLEPAKLETPAVSSVLLGHTRDPVVANTLNSAKERWFAARDRKEIEGWSIISHDGLQLSGYFKEHPKTADSYDSGKTVILLHGMMDSAAGMAYLAEEYLSKGWNVLAIDQRSHGESEGTKRTMGVQEAKDLELWVNYLLDMKHCSIVFIHGVSMGGATALLYAGIDKKRPDAVKGIISDSSYASYEKVFYVLVKRVVGNAFIAWSIIRGASFASALLGGARFSLMSPEKTLGKVKIPVLFFHGQGDLLVPVSQVRNMLSTGVKKGFESIVIPGAPHIGAYFYAPAYYMEKIESLYRRIM